MAKKVSKTKTSIKSGTSFSAAQALMQLIDQFDYKPDPVTSPLRSIVFWAGAGFSKSWEPSSPVGSKLFSIDRDSLGRYSLLSKLADVFGTTKTISYAQFRQIVYQLEMYDRYPDLRSRYFDDQNIANSKEQLRIAVMKSFNQISKLNYIDVKSGRFPLTHPTTAQKSILEFFFYLSRRSTGSGDVVEGLRLQFITTNYDFNIETILDNIINDPYDSLFNYTYRGITPRRIGGHANPSPLFDHYQTWHLLKLNGGFEIFPDPGGYVLDYAERDLTQLLDAPPVLILPSREQDYSDPYFRIIFPKAVRMMRETSILVLVGYSLPLDDALIRFIIRQFAEEPEDGFGKYLFYIDPLSDSKKMARLLEIFPFVEDRRYPRIFLYQGKFSDFAKQCVSIAKAAQRKWSRHRPPIR